MIYKLITCHEGYHENTLIALFNSKMLQVKLDDKQRAEKEQNSIHKSHKYSVFLVISFEAIKKPPRISGGILDTGTEYFKLMLFRSKILLI